MDNELRAFWRRLWGISIPFWGLGALIDGMLPERAVNLPFSALMAGFPALCAVSVSWQTQGRRAAGRLLREALAVRRILAHARWIAPLLLLLPGLLLAHYALQRLLGRSLPTATPWSAVAPLLLSFLAGAAGEEIGWQGFVYPRLNQHRSALARAAGLGVIWALWHVVPYLQTGNPPRWIIGQCAFTVGLRVVLVWAYLNTGRSVLTALVLHALSNTAVFMLPGYGAAYEPLLAAPLLSAVVAAIVLIWGRDLARQPAP